MAGRGRARITSGFLALLLALGAVGWLPADALDFLSQLQPGRLVAEPSFEACSYYFRPGDASGRNYLVEFRRAGAGPWRRAFEPVTDRPAGVWKGSLFDLAEDTAWQVRVLAPGGAEIIPPTEFRTWSSHPPIARTIDLSKLPPSPGGLVITDQGAPDGWIRYTAPPGWQLAPAGGLPGAEAAAITFRHARCVILENVTVVGGRRYGVLVDESDAVRILNCDISGWGRVGVQQFTNTGARGKYADPDGELINLDGGVEINRSARTVIERCYVHDPRGRANSWMYSHPAGPEAVHVNFARGGTVVRWNDFVGSDEHRWNDVIEASSNSAAEGGFFRDSDISGNFLAFGNDDGVELEGGGMNVRFYRNKVEGTTCGISTGACILGPQFVYGNLVANPGDESGLALMFFKNSHGVPQGGKRHFVNNTLSGPDCSAYGAYGKPIGSGRIGFMRNNVFVGNAARPPGEWARRDDFDRDLYWADQAAGPSRELLGRFRKVGQERHGAANDPQFADPAAGDFHLQPTSPARGQAFPVANLTPAGANLGAFDADATEVPFRPLALVAKPRQLDFDAPASRPQREVELSLPADAPAAIPYEIRQNRVFSWFKVEPAAGSVAPGQTVRLTVTVDRSALHGRPRFKGAFLVRTPTGLSRPVSVYAAADFHEDLHPAAAPDSVYLGGSDLDGGEPRRGQNATGSDAGPGRSVALTAKSPVVTATFDLPHRGPYSLLARARSAGDVMKRLNFSLAVDGALIPVRFQVSPDYEWNTGATNRRVIYLQALGELAPGRHRLRLQLLNGEMNISELILTTRPAEFFVDHWQRERD